MESLSRVLPRQPPGLLKSRLDKLRFHVAVQVNPRKEDEEEAVEGPEKGGWFRAGRGRVDMVEDGDGKRPLTPTAVHSGQGGALVFNCVLVERNV